MTTSEAVKQFLKAAQADGLRAATIKWYGSLLNSFVVEFFGRELPTITPNDMRDYIIHLRTKEQRYENAKQKPVQPGGLSEATVSGHVTALHAFFAWCANEFDMPNPMKNIKRPKKRTPIPKAIEDENFVKLFDAAGENEAGIRDRALLAFFADTGCRLGGALSLKLSNLDITAESAIVIEKGGHARNVSFTALTGRLLQRWIDVRASKSDYVFTSAVNGEPLTNSGISQILKRLKKRAGITGRCNPHSFRHGFARAYIKNGGSEGTLARILGNSIEVTFDTYAVFTNDEIKEFHHRHTPMKKLRFRLRRNS